MIADLDASIRALLQQELPAELLEQVTITFAAPDKNFPPQTVTLPAIDIFLYDIRENTDLRTSERLVRQQTSPLDMTLHKNNVPITCSYIITAWSGNSSNPYEDEHYLLSAVMQVLLRYRTLPETVLKGSLIGIKPVVRIETVRGNFTNSLGEFWTAMGGRPRPVLHFTATVPFYAQAPIKDIKAIRTVQTKTTLVHTTTTENQLAHQVSLVGAVTNPENQLVAGACIKLTSDKYMATVTAHDGYYHVPNLVPGTYTVNAFLPDNSSYAPSAKQQVTISYDAATGEVNLQTCNLQLKPAKGKSKG